MQTRVRTLNFELTHVMKKPVRSKQLFLRASQILPGGVDSPVRAFKAVGGAPLFIRRASGAVIEDVDGNRFIDYVMSWGPLIHGHAPRGLVQSRRRRRATRHQLRRADGRSKHELGERVRTLMPSIERVRFVSSGTEADDERRPRGARVHGARQDHQVRGLLPRPRRRVPRQGGLRGD